MTIDDALIKLNQYDYTDEQFISMVADSLLSLSKNDVRVFIEELFNCENLNKHKLNPYVLNLIISKRPFSLYEGYHSERFKLDKWCEPYKSNSYCCSIFSMYGQFVFACKFKNSSVYRLTISPRSSIYNFGINVVEANDFLNLSDIVILDLETTGLNPLTEDVIEIAFLDPSSGREYSRLLPIKRRKTVPEEITKLTGISDEMIKNETCITSKELDEIIDSFELSKKTILIWSGINMFDAHFLATLFIRTGNKRFCELKFVSAMDVIKKYSDISFNSYSKDYLANYLNINSKGSHRALNDCKIEAEIYKKLYSRKK